MQSPFEDNQYWKDLRKVMVGDEAFVVVGGTQARVLKYKNLDSEDPEYGHTYGEIRLIGIDKVLLYDPGPHCCGRFDPWSLCSIVDPVFMHSPDSGKILSGQYEFLAYPKQGGEAAADTCEETETPSQETVVIEDMDAEFRPVCLDDLRFSCMVGPDPGKLSLPDSVSWNSQTKVLTVKTDLICKKVFEHGDHWAAYVIGRLTILCSNDPNPLDYKKADSGFPVKIIHQPSPSNKSHTVVFEDGGICECFVGFLETPDAIAERFDREELQARLLEPACTEPDKSEVEGSIRKQRDACAKRLNEKLKSFEKGVKYDWEDLVPMVGYPFKGRPGAKKSKASTSLKTFLERNHTPLYVKLNPFVNGTRGVVSKKKDPLDRC
jgi:hypothetical protein